MFFKILIVVIFFIILWALGSACYNLVSKKGDSDKLFKSLAWRIGLSIGLFALLLLGGKMGWIKPHNPFQPKDPASQLEKPNSPKKP